MKEIVELAIFMIGGALAGLIALFMLAKSAVEMFLEAPVMWRVAVLVAAGAGVVGALYWHATLVPR